MWRNLFIRFASLSFMSLFLAALVWDKEAEDRAPRRKLASNSDVKNRRCESSAHSIARCCCRVEERIHRQSELQRGSNIQS